ncbi:CBS domain-containing protein [Pseudonocardia sp.]|uniref:CBS domain-containing protein n=1 Tax=Pseudonocardia sp. TaxID=60912 RepID=UPI003D0EDD35
MVHRGLRSGRVGCGGRGAGVGAAGRAAGRRRHVRPGDTAPGWQTVSAFAERLAAGGPESRHRSFPVVEFDGRVVGTVELADLARCPATERPRTVVRELARPLPPSQVLAAGAPLREVLSGPLARGSGLGVVVDGGRVVGVLTGADLVRAELGALATR